MNRESGGSFSFRRRRTRAGQVPLPHDPQPQRIDVAFPTAAEPSPAVGASGAASSKIDEKKPKDVLMTEILAADLPAGSQQVENPRKEDEEDDDGDQSNATSGEDTTTAVIPPPLNVIETEGGTEEVALRHPSQKNTGLRQNLLEVDFYRQPTLLSRLIMYQKYGSALQRLHNYPDEARVWVCAQRRASEHDSADISVLYMIRQLPIHLACANLGRTHDLSNRQLLHELLSTLIVTHPGGVHEADHQGRLPLHEAVWYGAEPDLIALFLMAQPSALHVVDSKGRTLQHLNRYRPGSQVSKDAVRKLLDRSVEFWATARDEARFRLKQNHVVFPSTSSDQQTPSSMCNLASSQRDDDSIVTLGSSQLQEEKGSDLKRPAEEIAPIAWEQLERRAMALEHILTEVNEKNYELNQRVDALTVLNRAQSRELVQELTRLNKENLMLNEKIHDIENLLLDAMPDEKKDQCRLALVEISSLLGLSNSIGSKTPILEETKEAHALRRELSKRTSKQRDQIRKMRIVLEGMLFGGNKDEKSHEASNSQDALSTVSPLTSTSSKSTLFSMAHPRFASGVDPSLEIPQHENNPVDDLDVLLHYAAAHDHAHRERRRQRMAAAEAAKDAHAPEPATSAPDTDDLSVLLRWAASQERPEANKRDQPVSVSSSWSPIKPLDKSQSKKQRGIKEWVLPAILPPSKSKDSEEREV